MRMEKVSQGSRSIYRLGVEGWWWKDDMDMFG